MNDIKSIDTNFDINTDIGIYVHGHCDLAETLHDYFSRAGFNSRAYSCLCLQEPKKQLEKVVLCHPADSDIVGGGCLTKIKSVIVRNSEVAFYILAVSNSLRVETIGEHPNVLYVREDNAREFCRRVYKRISDIEKARDSKCHQ